MRIIAALPFLVLSCAGCKSKNSALVNPVFIDSLLSDYQSPSRDAAQNNLLFWQKRMDSLPDNFVNGPRYASALLGWFRINGHIEDLRKADSLLKESFIANLEKEPEQLRIRASVAMLQHRFIEAEEILNKLVLLEGNTIPNAYLDFDISFERGRYARAGNTLQVLQKDESYGYYFRRSKYEHYEGSVEAAISSMLKAADKAGTSNYLRQIALSNAADLHLHSGDLAEAAELYHQSLKIDRSDLHSLAGLGWIALVHDKNDSLADSVFQFIGSKTKSPDILLKRLQLAEWRKDKAEIKNLATLFVKQASREEYGNMYAKYLIDFYTGILPDTKKAIMLGANETLNRPTPQVYAWYAWSLFRGGEIEKANEIFRGFVSKKPLEALELYYMGMMMKETGQQALAKQFFKAAWKNKYDLAPSMQIQVNQNLD